MNEYIYKKITHRTIYQSAIRLISFERDMPLSLIPIILSFLLQKVEKIKNYSKPTKEVFK